MECRVAKERSFYIIYICIYIFFVVLSFRIFKFNVGAA